MSDSERVRALEEALRRNGLIPGTETWEPVRKPEADGATGNSERLARLRALAEAATPGPWEWGWYEYQSEAWDGESAPRHRMFLDAKGRSHGHVLKITWPELLRDVDAEFIAALDPSTVLWLLDRLAELADVPQTAEPSPSTDSRPAARVPGSGPA